MNQIEHFVKFKVENFKRFETFEMDNLGQFNLIVGDNNVGKSSVLEALMAELDVYTFLINLKYVLFNFRKFNKLKDIYFYHYLNQQKGEKSGTARFQFNFSNQETVFRKVEISVVDKWHLTAKTNKPFDKNLPIEEQLALSFNADALLPYTNMRTPVSDNSSLSDEGFHAPYIPFQIFYDHSLAEYFDSHIEVRPSIKKKLLNDLKTILPDIKDITQRSSVAEKSVLAVIREGVDATLPLGTFGDGFIKLFRILIEMQIHSGKRLMIDEIDTGIYYRRMKDFWKTIIRSARNNNVQLFATTHNEECIGLYAQVLEEEGIEFQKDSRIIHLEEDKTTRQVKAYTFTYSEFDPALKVGSELR